MPKAQGSLLEDRAIALSGTRLVLGRFSQSSGPVDIELGDLPGGDTTSRHHAVLEFAGGGWRVGDAGSANGVFVRHAGEERFSAKIIDPARLDDGDEIGLGMMVLVLQGPSTGTIHKTRAEATASMPIADDTAVRPEPGDPESSSADWGTHET